MKKSKLFTMAFLFPIIFLACKTEEVEPAEKILGDWKMITSSLRSYNNAQKVVTVEDLGCRTKFIFSFDGQGNMVIDKMSNISSSDACSLYTRSSNKYTLSGDLLTEHQTKREFQVSFDGNRMYWTGVGNNFSDYVYEKIGK